MRSGEAGAEDGFDGAEVGLGVDPDGVVVDLGDVEGEAVFEPLELFEALGGFESAGSEVGEAVEGVAAIGVEAEVLPELGLGAVAVERDGGAGEVEGAAVVGGYDFDGVGVVAVFGRAGDFEGGEVDVLVGEGAEEGGDVFGAEEGFIALDVDVEVGGDALGDGVDAVGAAGKVGGGQLAGPALALAKGEDFGGVCRDDEGVELGAAAGGVVDPGEEGPAGELAEDFAGQASGGEAGGDDAEDAEVGAVFRRG